MAVKTAKRRKNKMRTDRLLRLADALTKLGKKRSEFHMGKWQHDVNRCGTPSCAAGWNAHLFPRDGLLIVSDDIFYSPEIARKLPKGCSGVLTDRRLRRLNLYDMLDKNQCLQGDHALAVYFGISQDAVNELFYFKSCFDSRDKERDLNSPEAVAGRLRDFVERKQK